MRYAWACRDAGPAVAPAQAQDESVVAARPYPGAAARPDGLRVVRPGSDAGTAAREFRAQVARVAPAFGARALLEASRKAARAALAADLLRPTNVAAEPEQQAPASVDAVPIKSAQDAAAAEPVWLE